MINRKRQMTIAIMAVSLSAVGLFMLTQIDSENANIFSVNPNEQLTQKVDFIKTTHGNFAVPGILGTVEASNVADTFFLTDEPANWFKSETGGLVPALLGDPDTPVQIPITAILPGQAVEFDLKSQTDAIHTVTLLVQPTTDDATNQLVIDQAQADDDSIRVEFTQPGTYLFACKVHPYMAGLVVVADPDPNTPLIPDITGDELGFIKKLGSGPLPAPLVASILTNIAPFDSAASPLGIQLGKDSDEKWDIRDPTETNLDVDGDGINAQGIGEIWIDAQFEAVNGQEDTNGNAKPGTIIVLDASDFSFKKKIDGLGSDGNPDPATIVNGENGWNNPHNMWTNVENDVVYNGNWFGQWLNKIDRDTGKIITTEKVGYAPTHIVTIPEGDEAGILTLPLSAEQDILKLEDNGDKLDIIDKTETGTGNNHPHGQWITSDGKKILIPNVFQGFGLAGSISIMDVASGDITEVTTDSNGDDLLLPVAVGIAGNKGYVSNIGAGTVSVVDLDDGTVINDIRVACFSSVLVGGDGTCAKADELGLAKEGIVLDTLKLPIQTPASPNGKFVVTAVFSLSSFANPDTIAVIDTTADGGKGALVAELPCPAGCHGVNWGANADGGYYAYVTSQHSNVMTVVDPRDGEDAAIVAQIVLAEDGDDVTVGTGGQGILPIPLVSNGWIQDTVTACDAGQCSPEVSSWIDSLAPSQKNPGT